MEPRVKYVFDTLFMAAGVELRFESVPPRDAPWLLYAPIETWGRPEPHRVAIAHYADAWTFFEGHSDAAVAEDWCGHRLVVPGSIGEVGRAGDVAADLVANAFYFLASWAERRGADRSGNRRLFRGSVFDRLSVPQDVVDGYLREILEALRVRAARLGEGEYSATLWPDKRAYAVVLSHDVDFLPMGIVGALGQGAKTLLRHLIRRRRPVEAIGALGGLIKALASGRDAYGCIPEIIAREKSVGVRSSFQVAVAKEHANDVNYSIQDDAVRDYLKIIMEEGFDLCLHGSYHSAEHVGRYVAEADLLATRLARPRGSRQHFLSFDYDTLFTAQERAGIRYDMSIGFPDKPGPRAGFSYPYFPYCLAEDRPYDVVEISLFLMDATLSGYLNLSSEEAESVIGSVLDGLRTKGGCASVVWHPIVFGGARDPGYDRLYWDMVTRIAKSGGLATDGRTANDLWRARALHYASFSSG
ncbi:polysaccharide deacetylase family protein [Thioalkalicoccus limnaeus]|uniref:Polysaccharide deacetylase family protein n=1 Tax=Thioalkalicoccus limnaeus TaxID=120681 RepID=A0ABV4BIG6_9GAMM